VISTSLYFVVFGAAMGSRITEIEGVAYGMFIVPGLIMLMLLTQSVANASFGIYFPRFTGTIYELLSAPVSFFEIVLAMWSGRQQIHHPGADHSRHRRPVRAAADRPSGLDAGVPGATSVTFSLLGFIIGIWADGFEKLADRAAPDHLAADLPGRKLLLHQRVAAGLADRHAAQSGGLPDQRIPLELFEVADVSVAVSLGMTALFLAVCLAVVWWIFKTGYRLKS